MHPHLLFRRLKNVRGDGITCLRQVFADLTSISTIKSLEYNSAVSQFSSYQSPAVAARELAGEITSTIFQFLPSELICLPGLPPGELHVFGSFSNGFKTGGSDLDIVYISDDVGNGAVRILQSIMALAEKYRFTNITKIFQANVGRFFRGCWMMERTWCPAG